MGQAYSVTIVGGGVIGLCTAWFLRRQGIQVTILERGAPDHDSCSLGNAGMVVPSHFVPLAAPGMVEMGLKMMRDPESPFALRPRLSRDLLEWGWHFMRACNAKQVSRVAPLLRDLNLQSRACYEQFSAEFGESFGLQKRGLLMLCKHEETLRAEAHLAEEATRLGLKAAVLNPSQLASLDPSIQMEVAGGVWFAQDCHLNPQLFVKRLTQALEAEGVRFVWGAEVKGWKKKWGSVKTAQTTQGDFSADQFVVAGGAWSPSLLRPLGIRLLLQGGKGYSMSLPNPPQKPEICAILTEARVAVTPMGETLRFAGTMEIAGTDLSVNEARVNGIRKSIPTYYPAFKPEDFKGVPVWSGLRPCSPDGLPYIGYTKRYNNLILATGHAMMGVSLAPITGRLVSELILEGSTSLDLSLLSPDRF